MAEAAVEQYVLPQRAICPVCKHSYMIKRNGQFRVHGYHRGSSYPQCCPGSAGRVTSCYEVIESQEPRWPRVGMRIEVDAVIPVYETGYWTAVFQRRAIYCDDRWWDFEGKEIEP